MTIRLSLEEDAMRQALVRALRSRGVDVITALEAGMIERPDEHHLAYATAQGRVLYSCNVGDFYRLHMAFLAQGKAHAGIILAPQQRYTVGEQSKPTGGACWPQVRRHSGQAPGRERRCRAERCGGLPARGPACGKRKGQTIFWRLR